jgi:hypothetical protein
MLALKYSACQDKFNENLEVIGGAGVRGEERVKMETRNQKLETRRRRGWSRGPGSNSWKQRG